MAQRNWENLSPAYQHRLERSGITRSDYESGVSLASARGHGATPEHPHAGKGQERYREYHERRNRLERHMVELKRQKFGSAPRWSESGAMKSAEREPIAKLEEWEDYDDYDDYWDDLQYEGREDAEADKYHD